MGQNQSVQHSKRQQSRQYGYRNNVEEIVEHEGVLKLRLTPFPNCVQINLQGSPLFIQNAQKTLHDLLLARFNTNKLLPYQDIRKLIESIVYTLAYFQHLSIPYRDLCPQNIYYCQGQFKLLPNQLIEQNIMQKVCQKDYNQNKQQFNFVILSPEMIIALRYKQLRLDDQNILHKSNVFILGMILLQTCTMIPSSQCYDNQNYDIFNHVITERLELVEENYDGKIARIIANMIDYDYSERMLMRDIAIYVNREFRSQNQVKNDTLEIQQLNFNPSSKVTKMNNKEKGQKSWMRERPKLKMQTSESELQTDRTQSYRKGYPRKNQIYLSSYTDQRQGNISRRNQPKNRVYLSNIYNNQHSEIASNKQQNKGNIIELIKQRSQKNQNIYFGESKKLQSLRKFVLQQDQRFQHHLSTSQKQKNKFKYQLSSQETDRIKKQQDINFKEITNMISYRKNTMRDNYSQAIRDPQRQFQFLHTNKFSSPILKQNNCSSEITLNSKAGSYNKQIQNKDYQDESFHSRQFNSKQSFKTGSINKIKLEIEKSKRLIEDFRKSECYNQQ